MTELRSFDDSLPMALLKARERAMRVFRPVLADHDLTEQQWRVLRALSSASTELDIGEIADATFLLGPSLTRNPRQSRATEPCCSNDVTDRPASDERLADFGGYVSRGCGSAS